MQTSFEMKKHDKTCYFPYIPKLKEDIYQLKIGQLYANEIIEINLHIFYVMIYLLMLFHSLFKFS